MWDIVPCRQVMNVLSLFPYFGLYDKTIRTANRNSESGSDEMEEEPCGPEFPLTRRGPKFGGKSGASKEIERHSLQDENRFFLEMVKDPSTEITNGNVDRERALRTQDKASSSREVDNRFLSRIQEDVDECADTSLPYEDSHLAADNETGNGSPTP